MKIQETEELAKAVQLELEIQDPDEDRSLGELLDDERTTEDDTGSNR